MNTKKYLNVTTNVLEAQIKDLETTNKLVSKFC